MSGLTELTSGLPPKILLQVSISQTVESCSNVLGGMFCPCLTGQCRVPRTPETPLDIKCLYKLPFKQIKWYYSY